jgi:hypothetical protein
MTNLKTALFLILLIPTLVLAQGTKRAPAHFVPNDDVEPQPIVQNHIWLQDVFVKDDEGHLDATRNQIAEWSEKEEYAKNWNVKSTGLYNTPEEKEKKSYFNRQMLKYADKRLAGEVKNSEEGSVMQSVGQAQKALAPSAQVGISKNVKVKFRARVLQGKASMAIENPYLDHETEVKTSGSVNMKTEKNLKSIGLLAGVDYAVTEKTWTARFDKTITERISARVSSSQTDKSMAFSADSDRIVQVMYSLPF